MLSTESSVSKFRRSRRNQNKNGIDERSRNSAGAMKKMHPRDMIIFFQGLHALLNAGLGLMAALELQIRERQSLARELMQVAACLREGQAFSSALSRYLALPHDILVMLQLGENTGDLVQACQFCIQTLQSQAAWKRSLWQMSFYPVLLLITSFALCWVMMGFVLPEFASLYQTLNVSLPSSTAWLLGLAEWAPDVLAKLGCFLLLLIVIMILACQNIDGRYLLEQFFFHCPILNRVMRHHCQYQIAQQLGTLLRAGTPLLTALEFMRNSSRSPIFSHYILNTQQRLQEGQSVRTSFSHGLNQDPRFKALLAQAEQTGQLDTLFICLASQHKETLIHWQDRAKHMIQPIITLILGGFLGIWILLLYYPMLQLGTNLG
jgi:protein transport protein HofC